MNSFISIFKKQFEGDKVIWRIFFFFMIISLLAVYTASYQKASRSAGIDQAAFSMLIKQATGFLIGFVVMFFVHKRGYHIFFTGANIILGLSIASVLLLHIGFGVSKNDAVRWVNIFGFSFQPSEFAKFAIIIFTAKQLAINQQDIGNKKKVLYPIAIATFVLAALLWKAGFSTVMFMITTVFVMLILGRLPMRQIGAIAGIGAFAGIIILGLALKSPETLGNRGGTIQTRITTYMPALKKHANIVTTKSDSENSLQSRRALTAVALGQSPAGPGNSIMKKYLPEAESDFIFSIIIEEYSLVAALLLISLYIILIFRIGRFTQKVKLAFPLLLLEGLTFYIVFQAFIHMGINVDIFPVTGQTLPFISWGSTSLVISCLSLGVILSITREVNKEAEAEKKTKLKEVTEEPKE